MNFASKSLIAAAAFVAATGSAQAITNTLTAGGSVTDAGWTLDQLQGSGTLSFSSLLISALNTAAVSLGEVSPATLSITTSTNSVGVRRFVSASAAAPIASLTGSFDGEILTVEKVGTSGGATQTTIKNSATTGPGFLSISNLNVDLTTKTVFADIEGANGVGKISQYALWSYNNITGPTTFAVPDPAVQTVFTSENTITGLFASQATIDDIFVKGLALGSVGKSGLTAVNDPTKGGGAGFGTIVSKITVIATPNVVTPAIPEPSTYALMGLGLVGIGLVARRRAN
ncbi:PEP-CTERM sorting domain-containing protein [uncultured Aquabacterium sp.]|uniref:PEP-CTERM sorting domain-containing protein n=1 Tax=uncultured Aquabacterium sp. TaxID=158753 RepID=UPI0030CFB15C